MPKKYYDKPQPFAPYTVALEPYWKALGFKTESEAQAFVIDYVRDPDWEIVGYMPHSRSTSSRHLIFLTPQGLNQLANLRSSKGGAKLLETLGK